MLGDALAFPRRGDDWLKTIVIGGVLSLLGGFLLIPILPVQGYLVRVLDSGVRDDHEPPVFDEWGDLFVDGILLFVIQFVYALVPFLVFAVGAFVVGVGAFAAGGSEAAGAGVGILGLLVFGVGGLLSLLVAYFIPAAVANFAYEDEFAAAFDVSRIREAAFTKDYFVAVVLAIVVAVVLGSIAAILTLLIVGIFLTFYVQVVFFFLVGRGFGEALGIDDGGSGPTHTSRDDDIPDPDPLT
jgi:hypothetical protein